jgi:hypothetical protein
MKKIVLFFVLLIGFSCNDGDLDISSFEFEDEVNICGVTQYTLYRLSTNEQRESLIVTLTDQQIRKDEDLVIPVAVSENGNYTVTYRLFDDQLTDDYFCSAVPPVDPTVIKDWRGVAGTIIVQNEPIYDTEEENITGWKHYVVLVDVVLRVDDEELKLDETFVFGTAETGPAAP